MVFSFIQTSLIYAKETQVYTLCLQTSKHNFMFLTPMILVVEIHQ